ncbi:unnamed protein product [Calypogeia fissa]
MDVLLFWVALGFLVEATRKAVHKCCVERKKKDKEGTSLREPLLKPEEVLDASGRCGLPCCSHKFESAYIEEPLEEEYPMETSEEEIESLGRLSAITDDSEDLESEPGVKVIKWEDLVENVSVTLVGERRTSLKGKEIVEEMDDYTTDSEIIPVRSRRESRGKSSAKIYPEPPPDPSLTSIHDPDYQSIDAGQSSSEYGLKIYDHSSWDQHFKANAQGSTLTGECSKS